MNIYPEYNSNLCNSGSPFKSNNRLDINMFLKSNDIYKKLNYYQRGLTDVVEDKFCLMGFKNNLPVVSSAEIKCREKGPKGMQNIITRTPLQTDSNGNKFIILKGQKLRVVPSNQIPEGMKTKTILIKKSAVVKTLKNPPQINVINDTSSKTSLVSKPTDNNCFRIIGDDCTGIDSIAPTNVASTTHSTVSLNVSPAASVKPTTDLDAKLISCCYVSDGADVSDLDNFELLPQNPPSVKLLCERNLKVLNQVKMQALNLSVKKNMVVKKLVLKNIEVQKSSVEVGIQTELQKETVTHRGIQTEFPQDRLTFPEDESYNNLIESVLLNDVNFGMGPTMGKVLHDNYPSRSFTRSIVKSPVESESGIRNCLDNGVNAKKMMFFQALRECAVYNVAGYLPLHEGVVRNDLDAVKLQCVALKARKLGVNMETHDGCTPLQLAIIYDVQSEIVKTLLDYRADIKEVDGEGNNILHLAAKFQRHEALGIILVHKAFDECAYCIDDYNFEGLTPLMICCMRSWTAGALLLIGNRAKVNCKDQTSGRTALFHAAEAQNPEIVRILLDHHADPKIKNFFGTSPHDAMYELDDMSETIKNLIFGRSKKRSIEAEMNPVRTAKAAKKLKTYPKLQKVERKGNVFITPVVRQRIAQQIK